MRLLISALKFVAALLNYIFLKFYVMSLKLLHSYIAKTAAFFSKGNI